MSVFFRHNEHYITIMGQTYPHKEIFKSLNGSFLATKKIWKVPMTKNALNKIQNLCSSLDGGDLQTMETENLEIPTTLKTPLSDLKENKTTINKHCFSIKEVITKITQQIKVFYPQPIWIIGEIEQINHKNNACFFLLSEKKYSSNLSKESLCISAVIWKNSTASKQNKHLSKLLNLIQEGIKICLLCQVNFYENRSQISLTVLDVDSQYSEGILAFERKQTLKKLQKNNLKDLNKNLNLDLFALNIGLISARRSRAYSDFCHQLTSRNFPGTILFNHANMQGKQVTQSIITALKHLSTQGCQAIIITRGGGSQADLRWFDDYILAEFVAKYSIPVISAIGHHDDVSILEEISYKTCKTPTDAADFLIDNINKLNTHFEFLSYKLINSSTKKIQKYVDNKQIKKNIFLLATNKHMQKFQKNYLLQKYSLKIKLQEALIKIKNKHLQVTQNISHFIQRSIQKNLHRDSLIKQTFVNSIISMRYVLESKTSELHKCLNAIDPTPWLKRGWTQLKKDTTKLLSIKQIKKEDILKARLPDGEIKLKVLNITKESHEP
jgi:exodeoxyribonuclease VII large subunit